MARLTGQMERRALIFLIEEEHLRWPIFFVAYRAVNERLQVVEKRFHKSFVQGQSTKKPF